MFHAFFNGSLDLVFVGAVCHADYHIRAEILFQFSLCLLHAPGENVGEDHAGPLVGKGPCHASGDSAASSGKQYNTVFHSS